jgi:hypothetical protein
MSPGLLTACAFARRLACFSKMVFIVWTTLSVVSCSTEKPVATIKSPPPQEPPIASVAANSGTSANPTDERPQREIDLAATRERNKQHRPAFTTAELHKLMAEPTHTAHLKLWRELHSYYALLELVEGIIEPEIGRMRRQDVRELLGEGDPDYPGSAGHSLAYGSNRHLTSGAHLLIGFDEQGMVKNIRWVSE